VVNRSIIGTVLGGLALIVGTIGPFEALSSEAQRALGLALFALIFWTTEPVSIELSSLVVLLLLPTLGLLSFEESFAPFAGKTVWLIFAGMVLSLGITETGLGERLANRFIRHLGRTPFMLLLHLHLIGLATAFLIPSGVVRVLLLVPIGLALAEHLGSKRQELLAPAVLLSLVCSTYYGGCGILTGSVPNLVVVGQLERVRGEIVFWSTWFQWMFPVLGLARTGLSLGVVWFLFGRRLVLHPLPPITISSAGLLPSQRRIIFILLLGVTLWATDTFHQIPPAFVALFLVLLYLIPGWGPLPSAALRKVNFPFLFYIAALFSLGSALEVSGFNDRFIAAIAQWVDLASLGWLGRHLAMTLIGVPFDFLMDIAAVAGGITPTLLELGATHGMADLPIAMSVGMATTLAFLPYQAAPFMVAYSFRRFSLSQLVLCMLLISFLSLLLLCPLNIAYWRWLGLI
jgi:anion transporter